MSDQLEKREWCYAGAPASYDIPGCKCGNNNCVYSEWSNRLWCDKCEIDFVPEHFGIFDGPIPWEVSQILGYNFDRIDLVRNVYQECRVTKDGIDWFDLNEEELNARLASHRVTTLPIGGKE